MVILLPAKDRHFNVERGGGEGGSERAREQGSKGARDGGREERGSEGARERGSEGASEGAREREDVLERGSEGKQ